MYIFNFIKTIAESQILTMPEKVRAGTNITLSCSTPCMTNTIGFYKDNSPKEACAFISVGQMRHCSSDNPRYKISQDVSTNVTLLNIRDVSIQQDRGQWQCSFGTKKSPKESLHIYGRSFDIENKGLADNLGNKILKSRIMFWGSFASNI